MLELENVEAGYGQGRVLAGVSFTIGAGEVAALMGRNGMGKTTTVRAIMGALRPSAGTIRFAGRRLDGLAPHRIARAGLGLVPEGREVFPNLTVQENLNATARAGGPWTFARVLDLFPRLGERLDQAGSRLSGGEQQMLAIGRALMTNPRLLVLDEATEGLAPLVRDEIWRCLAGLKAEGTAILVIDKHVERLAELADRSHVLEKGRVVWSGDTATLRDDPTVTARYLGV
jgi:branched-chain amino acid transport system ATP-binding protein